MRRCRCEIGWSIGSTIWCADECMAGSMCASLWKVAMATFHKLAHMLPAMHSSAHHIVEPMDHPISHRHLRITHS